MTAQAQAAEVNKVKRHEAGMVADPITIGPDMIVADVIRLTREHNISGLPVVQGEKSSRYGYTPRPSLRRPHGRQDQ